MPVGRNVLITEVKEVTGSRLKRRNRNRTVIDTLSQAETNCPETIEKQRRALKINKLPVARDLRSLKDDSPFEYKY